MNINLVPIELVGLSPRSSNALRRSGIMTVGDLLKQSEEYLRSVRNLGEKSIAEIMAKADEYRALTASQGTPEDSVEDSVMTAANDETNHPSSKLLPANKCAANNDTLDSLTLLSARARNLLHLNDISALSAVLYKTESELLELTYMDEESAREIERACRRYRFQYEGEQQQARESVSPLHSVSVLISLSDNREAIVQYVKQNDVQFEAMGLGTRACNQLRRAGHKRLSDILFLSYEQLLRIPSMGTLSAQNIIECRTAWLERHKADLQAIVINGANPESLVPIPDENATCSMVLRLYTNSPYAGLSLQDFRERIPESVETNMLKHCIGKLISEKALEYVDYRCYRVYPRFEEIVRQCTVLSEQNRTILQRRLKGDTLEAIAQDLSLTRERIRQLTNKSCEKVRNYQLQKLANETVSLNCGSENEAQDSVNPNTLFDEDYYRYFYSTYEFEKRDASIWLGISDEALCYLAITCKGQGDVELVAALEDRQIDAGLRQRVRNYLNRNKIYLDGQWIPKKRGELEKYYIEHFCREEVSYNEFRERYNAFLKREGIPFDDSIYETDETINTRRNHLSEAHFLLWKYGERLRAYDVDGRDYDSLFSELGLDVLENIEISTQKLVEDHPAILEQYDIRDQYELHNLLRKVLENGRFHGFTIKRTPNILFGTFDRDKAILELMMNNAPITQADLADIVHQEYGYDTATVIGTYFAPIANYYHQGVFAIEQKTMTDEHRSALLNALNDDFYFIDEIKRIYALAIPDADTNEVNPFTLKQMGFYVYSSCALRGHNNQNSYFRELLTSEDLLDITDLRRRFTYVQSFSATLLELKRTLEVVEYEPNKIINFRKLASAGITKEDIQQFCDEVWAYVEDGAYFSATFLRLSGFQTELYELGFSDWFYANLLLSDSRFSFGIAFKSIILRKGDGEVTIRSFETSLIREAGSIDVYDLQNLMEKKYGCCIPDRLDLIYKVDGGAVYYDRYLDRLYDSEDRYQRELDRMEDG